MSDPALALLIVLYGGLILCGGLAWLMGRLHGNEKLAKVGEITVCVGLCIDLFLLVSNWLFGWIDWTAAGP